MRYQPSIASNNNNISHTHPLREFATLLGGILILLLLSYIVLGFLVDRAVEHISVDLETELFKHTPFTLLATGTDLTDPRHRKIQQLTDSLKKCLGIKRPITVHLQDSDTINAVAIPGGHIIIFTGLLNSLDTENSLSFILGHELGHFKNRDHLKGLGRGIVLMTIATAITGPTSGLTKLLTPAIQLSQAGYSQNRELQADQIGLTGLHCYYGHIGGATQFFADLASRQEESLLSHYFGSHPQMQERMQAMHKQAESKHYLLKKPSPLSFSQAKQE